MLRYHLTILFLTCSAIGCGNSLPATVSGTISVDSEPLSGNAVGEVMFHPSGGGAMAMAPLKSDGTYEINTGSTKGLETGAYDVTVRVALAGKSDGQNAPMQKQISPARYNDKEQSKLSAKVEPGKNVFDFDLDSK